MAFSPVGPPWPVRMRPAAVPAAARMMATPTAVRPLRRERAESAVGSLYRPAGRAGGRRRSGAPRTVLWRRLLWFGTRGY
jgi:hypothetical protein